jgi:diaminopimelate epimerase
VETQVKVNGQVIILADTNPLHKIEYCQWKNINTGQIWNIDGSEAEVCFNAELAEHGKITFLAPLLNVELMKVEINRQNNSLYHRVVDNINTNKDVNQIQVHNLYDDNIFVDIWEKGVGYVPSCGTGAAAAALFSDKDMVEVYCRGGKYIIEKDYYRWSMTAENIS